MQFQKTKDLLLFIIIFNKYKMKHIPKKATPFLVYSIGRKKRYKVFYFDSYFKAEIASLMCFSEFVREL
jgi:hypothetical protein